MNKISKVRKKRSSISANITSHKQEVGFPRDVDEQRQTPTLVSKGEAVGEVDRLKGQLLSTVSHELRSPLAVIKGYAATLSRYEQQLEPEERHEFLRAIEAASDRLEMMLNRVLELSQLESGTMKLHFELVNLRQLISEAMTVAQYWLNLHDNTRQQREPIAFVLDNDDAFPPLQADRRLLREALDVVLENAIKYSPMGGIIHIVVRLIGGRLVISVQDKGIGIPPEHLEQIFDRFQRVDTSLTQEVGGLGLGLALCKRIVELHGGTVWAESQLGEGSTVYLSLPLEIPAGTKPALLI